MLSVVKHTSNPVKFWFLENFLSPSFKVHSSMFVGVPVLTALPTGVHPCHGSRIWLQLRTGAVQMATLAERSD